MGVPAHDERDHKVASKFALPIVNVLHESEKEDGSIETTLKDSDEFDGLDRAVATQKIGEKLEEKSSGRAQTMYRIRDWLVSRQRYWGAPMPIVHWYVRNPSQLLLFIFIIFFFLLPVLLVVQCLCLKISCL